MQVAVIHTVFEDAPTTVALIEVGDMTENEALNYAFRATQNIDGSWSRGVTFEHAGVEYDNPDFDQNVKVMAALPVSKMGYTMGHRSTMVGDQILVGTKKFVVEFSGFEQISA